MNSDEMYYLGRLKNEHKNSYVQFTNKPSKVVFEYKYVNPEALKYRMPGRILSASEYCFSGEFGIIPSQYETFDLLFLRDGSFSIAETGKKESAVELEAGSIVMLRTNRNYDFFDFSSETTLDVIRCAGSLSSSYEWMLERGGIAVSKLNKPDIFTAVMDSVCRVMKYPTLQSDVILLNNLTRLLTEMYLASKGNTMTVENEGNPPWFSKVIEYISENYMNNLTVDQLANLTGVGSSTFHTIFSAHTGQTPYQYITKLRLENALNLLHDEKRQIKDIAISVGFRSVSNFIKKFREVYGVTPEVYRSVKFI